MFLKSYQTAFVLSAFILIIGLSCVKKPAKVVHSESSYKNLFSAIERQSSLVAFLNTGLIKIRIDSPSLYYDNSAVIDSAHTWLQSIRKNFPHIDINFEAGSHIPVEQADLVIYHHSNEKGRAYTLLSNPIEIHMYQDFYGSYSILLHEMGHAFGLADTYLETGGCQQGQPDSVMCNGTQVFLTGDDVKGANEAYCIAHPNKCSSISNSFVSNDDDNTNNRQNSLSVGEEKLAKTVRSSHDYSLCQVASNAVFYAAHSFLSPQVSATSLAEYQVKTQNITDAETGLSLVSLVKDGKEHYELWVSKANLSCSGK